MSTDNPAGSNDISLADEGRVRQVLVDSVLGLWDVVNNRPPILVGTMWPGDMTIPRCVADADEAIVIVREHHAAWLKRD